jgi:hypothetical protein
MNQTPRKCASLVLALVLAACSRDPAKQKVAFLVSGKQLVKEGKYQDAASQFRNSIEIALGSPFISN